MYRSIGDWEWYHDDRCVRLFLHLLIKSNWSEGRWMGEPVAPGQLITSSLKLAEQLGWSRSAVVRTLAKLKSTGEVDTISDSKWTLVTLANWDKYQGEDAEPDSKPIRKRTRTGQQPDTIEEGKKGRREEGNIEARREGFVAACKAVIEANPSRLHKILRQGFHDYWTEASANGRMRFEDQDYFDHGRRMDTWQKKAEERGELKGVDAEGKPVWNARA